MLKFIEAQSEYYVTVTSDMALHSVFFASWISRHSLALSSVCESLWVCSSYNISQVPGVECNVWCLRLWAQTGLYFWHCNCPVWLSDKCLGCLIWALVGCALIDSVRPCHWITTISVIVCLLLCNYF